jgi:hypothetical protein
MCKSKRKVLLVLSALLGCALLLGAAYAYEKSRFVQQANAAFDSRQKAFRGIFLPWPFGHPTLVGGLDSEAYHRVRSELDYKSGSLSSNGMTLILHDSAGTFQIDAN